MSDGATTITMLVTLLAASAAVCAGGVVLAVRADGRLQSVGVWTAIAAGLLVLAWGSVLLMGALASAG
ncbi:hypothetical protein [Agrococcus carbonis]|uniref:Uncharacterized protein n=1 Tax=Agrococcus carbonis TaxID=684552 RepID=A0A1H1N040_9MICO|nr:hypothetical protein [Agrococcus carbonis]SDR92491.1 hypothetical protein SAMN04489719_1135 [Agrococcus carbonis]